MTNSLANDLAYLEGQVSAALRHDAGKKLRCKEGYVQRGSACQKINPNKAEGEVATTTSNSAKTRNAYLQGSAAILGLAVPALAIALSKKGAEAKEFLKQEGIVGLIDSGIEISTKIQGKEASIKKADSPLTMFRRVGRAAIGLYVAKDLAEYTILKAMGLRLETHSTSKENAKKIIEGGGYLDPSKGGSGAAAGLEDFKKNSTGYVHITGVHDKLYTHDPVFVSNFGRDKDGNFSRSAKKFVGWVKKDRDPYLSKAGRESLGLEMSDGDSLEKGRMPANPVLGYLTGKMQRVMYSGMGGLSEEEKKLPIEKQIPKAFLKSLTGRGGKTLYVANTEQFFRDNFVPDSDDFALKTDKPLKVYSNKYEAIFNAVKDKYRKDSDDRLSIEDDDLVMLGALISSAKRIQKKTRSDSRKLKCREGYVQRGSACQKITAKVGDNNLARNIGAGLGAAALVGGAAAIASRKPSSTSPTPVSSQPQTPAAQPNSIDPRLVKVAKVAAITAATYLSAKKLDRFDKDLKISHFLGVVGTAVATVKSRDLEKSIEGASRLSPEQKSSALELIGKTKVAILRVSLSRGEYDLESVDKQNNSFTYRNKKTGTIQTVGSAGASLLLFKSEPVGYEDNPTEFEMGFGVDFGVDREPARSIQSSKALIRIAKAAYSEHIRLLPDTCAIGCTVANADGAGSKRNNIYQQAGFAPIEGMGKFDLATAKVDGVVMKVKTEADKAIVRKIAKR